MSLFKNFFEQVKDAAEKGKLSISKAIDTLAQTSDLDGNGVILPWEREDLEPEIRKYLKDETFRYSTVLNHLYFSFLSYVLTFS